MQVTQQAANPEDGRKAQQHLTLMIGGKEYAASLLKVKKLIEYDTDSEVLRTWEWIRGMSGVAANSTGENGHQTQTIPSEDCIRNQQQLRT